MLQRLGASLVKFKSKLAGAVERILADKMSDTISVKDFGAKGDGVTDDTSAIIAADAAAYRSGQTLELPAGVYIITKTIIRKANWHGAGTANAWNYDGKGTVILVQGAGTPARWTDVGGDTTDPSDYTPAIVSGKSGLSIEKMTIKCEAARGRWHAGLFFPSVRRQIIREVDVLGDWKDAAVRIDATWGHLNTTLTRLHPEIESDTACNEYTFDFCYIKGLRGLRIQGTRRSKDTEPFVWSYGGTSDININNCRLGTDGPLDERQREGAGFWADAVINNAAGAGQGINFLSSTLRVSSKYCVYLDHINRVEMVNTYGETIKSYADTSGNAINYMTSNTGHIAWWNDNNNHRWWKDGSLVEDRSLPDWNLNRSMTKMRADGYMVTPNFYATALGSEPLRITSFQRDGTITLARDTGTDQVPHLLISNTTIRPINSRGMTLGTTSYPFGTVNLGEGRFGGEVRPDTPNAFNCGTSGYPWAGGYTQTAFTVVSDERFKTRPLSITDKMLDAWSKVDFIQYQYIDRVIEKGDEGARYHFGVVAQRAKEAFESEGLDPYKFAFFCFDEEYIEPAEYDEDGLLVKPEVVVAERFGIRYEEALVLEAALQRRNYQRLQDKISNMEAMLKSAINQVS